MQQILILLLLINFSCKRTSIEKEIIVEKIILSDTLKKSNDILSSSKEKQNESIYIGALKKIYKENDYYISLSFNESLPESFYSEFHEKKDKYIGELISKTENHERFKIDNSTAKKIFNTKNLESLIVFDNKQQIIDTLHIKNYEYLSDQIKSQVIATYGKSSIVNKDKDYLCISKNNIEFKKNIDFKENSNYLKKVLFKNGFKYSNIHSNYKLIKNKDTIAFASFGFFQNDEQKESFYLFKNGKPIDSIINNYSIYKMNSVPINLDYESLYVSYEHIPDTGSFWISLKGIDLKNNKLKIYSGNRFIRSE